MAIPLGANDVVDDWPPKPSPPEMLTPVPRGAKSLAPQDVVEDLPSPKVEREHRDRGGASGFMMGVLQGASFGLGDELYGLSQAMQPGDTAAGFWDRYKIHRDKIRGLLHDAQEYHPLATGAGQVVGGLVTTPLALPVGGTGFAANAARGAFSGALTGLGASEADTARGVIQDAAKGGLVGAAIGGTTGWLAQKATRGAQGRIDERTVQDITGGRGTAAGKKIYANEDLALGAAKKFNLQPDAEDPAGLLAQVKAPREEVGQKIGANLQLIGDETLGARAKDITQAVKAVRADYSGPSEAPIQRQIDRYLDDLTERWGDGRARVSLRDLNAEIGNLEKVGFAGNDLTINAGKQLKRDIAGALEDVLQNRLEEVKDLGGQIAKSSLAKRDGFSGIAKAAQAAQELPDLNRDYRGLKLIESMAKERAALPPASRAAGGLRNAINQGVDMSILFHNPLAYAAKKGIETAAPAIARGADQALAALHAAASAGQVTAQLIQQAIEAGVPRGLVEPFAAQVTTKQEP